jgi:hypothetical protein
METKTTSNRMSSLLVLYDMQTKFFSNALEAITDKDAHNRLNTKANHVAWLTGSNVQQRYEMAKHLGIDSTQATNEFFKDNKGIQDSITYPPLAEFKKDWDNISPVLRDALVNVSDEKLDSTLDLQGHVMSIFDLIAFVIYREANIIGQIALWRRLLGYEAMKYM